MILPSPSLANLAPALVAAQAGMPTVPKTATGQVRGKADYRYADLDAIWTVLRPHLEQHGLSVTQFPSVMEDGRAGLSTMLLHTSGEWLVDEMPLSVEGGGPQAQGSGITYARRYALCAVLGIGISSDEDDDGQAAQGSGRGTGSRRASGRADNSSASTPTPSASGDGPGEARAPADQGDNTPPAWHRDLMAAFGRIGLTDPDRRDERLIYCAQVTGRRVESTRDLTAREAGTIIAAIAKEAT